MTIEERVDAIARFLAASCPLCHGLGVYTAGVREPWNGRPGEIFQEPCYHCADLRAAQPEKAAP